MGRTTLLVAAALASLGLTGSARASMVAGWDFSQYLSGFLSTDGSTFTDTLSANYSNLDWTKGAGAESAAFGAMYIDGTNGSTDVQAGSGSEVFNNTSLSLSSNLTAPVTGFIPGLVPFDSLTVLTDEGQQIVNELKMVATDAFDVVFSADLTSTNYIGKNWSISFGGQTAGAASSTVDVSYSTTGIGAFTSAGSIELDPADKLFSVDLDSAELTQLFVKLSFVDAGLVQNAALIDNVAIDATLIPEPATAALLLAGLAGLGRLGTRCRRV